MKLTFRLLTAAAVLATPSLAAASTPQADPVRAAELLCSLGGLCAVAEEEANREVGEDENADAVRGIIGSRDVRNAGSRQAAPTPTPAPAASRPRNTQSSASNVTRAPRGSSATRQSSASQQARAVALLNAPKISLEVREKIAAPLVVTFATNSAALSSEARSEIAALAVAMKRAQELGEPMKLLIEGHASRGPEGRVEKIEPWNQTLSERRAAAVRNELLKAVKDAKIDPDQVLAKGMGSSRPLEVEGVKPTDKINQRVVAVPVS